ncbi:UDP binding domain-containing protein, partial [Streptomyces sp. UMAF16]|nr:UDP binding domain-containing protein [Streptomyces sp. UMAF16]
VQQQIGDRIHYAKDQYEALQNADALIIATEWNEFRTPDFDEMVKRMNQKTIFDGRNLFEVKIMQDKGFYY